MSDTMCVRLLGMSGSLRAGSYSNAVLATLRERLAGRADLRIYGLDAIPLYNQDLEGEQRPPPVKELLAAIAAADGLVVCAPEFNHSMPGVLKNALDWASRPAFASVMAHKPVAIMVSSPGAQSGAHCLAHLRTSLASMLARISVANDVMITSVGEKICNGRLVDEVSLRFASEAIEALLAEIPMWRRFDAERALSRRPSLENAHVN